MRCNKCTFEGWDVKIPLLSSRLSFLTVWFVYQLETNQTNVSLTVQLLKAFFAFFACFHQRGTSVVGKPNELLRTARERQGLTQAEVAEEIGCPNSVNISRWENGITFPSRHYRQKLCALYGKSPRELGLIQNCEEVDISDLAVPVFLFNEPLSRAAEMYGRRRERETLITRTARKASTSITGPRRIGKTWLMHYLRLIAPGRLGARFRIGYLDGMSSQCRTVAGFAAQALSKLGLPVSEGNAGLASLERGLQELVAKKLVPVLCIDEFERISDRQEFSLDFYEGLRAMTTTLDLVLVIASKNPLHLVVSKNAQGSPFFNIFERLLLKPFTYTDAEQFIREKSNAAGFTPQERDYLWKYGRESEDEQAWLPLRLQLTGKILSEDLHRARREPDYERSFAERFQEIYAAVVY